MDLSSVRGDGTRSSSDGQRFGVRASSLLGVLYPRYFGYYDRAVSVYTHTTDQFSVCGSRAISCSAREAVYVLDGLLENDTILRPPEHSTDTHGYTEHLFGLCYLLGFSFMPRMRAWPISSCTSSTEARPMTAWSPGLSAPLCTNPLRLKNILNSCVTSSYGQFPDKA